MQKYIEILNQWAEYSNYDKNKSAFKLGNSVDISKDYNVHKANKKIETILSFYDPTGSLAVIMAKLTFVDVMKNKKISMYDMFANYKEFEADKKMFDIFHSDIVKEAEQSYIMSIENIIQIASSIKKIGISNDDNIKKELFNATDNVIHSFDKCNEDLFIKGGEIQPISNFSTKIHIFETLAQCLTVIEKIRDGLYLCYINQGGSADGSFGFFLKSNGNILSINDRINESYQGIHKHSRNARWTEDKQDSIFPYDYIFDYSNHDYKGYATKYSINENCLDFFELEPQVYMPIIVAMVLINGKYVNKTIDLPIKFVDSLLPVNIMQISDKKETSLINLKNSSVIESYKSIDLTFNNDKILTGDYAEEFDNKNDYKWDGLREKGFFRNENQELVDLWGIGFEHVPDELYKSDSILINDKNYIQEDITAEFIGTEKRLRLQGYYKVREQLADYMMENMYKAWCDFGKTVGINKWYINSLKENKNHLEKMMVEHYRGLEDGTTKNVGEYARTTDENVHLDMCYIESKYPSGYSLSVLNDTIGERYKSKFICPITSTRCTIFFIFKPKDYHAIEELVNTELPDIIKYWKKDRNYAGNPNLDVTDKVARIGTIVEHNMDWWIRNVKHEQYSEYNFYFAVGYSKRGFNQMLKKHACK